VDDRYGLIDCDVHPLVMNAADTFRHMPVAWRKHFDFPEFLAAAGRVDRYRGMQPANVEPDPVNADPKRLAAEYLDSHRVDVALLVPMQGASLNARVDAAGSAVLASALNGYFTEQWLEVDARYRLAACVAPHEPRRAVREIRQRAKDPRVAAVLLPLWTLPMGSTHYEPIYAAAEEAGLPIVVHPTGVEGHYQGVQQLGGGTHRSLSSRQVLLHELAESNISSLIFEGVFIRHPGLRVIFSECSFAWSAAFLWRLDKEARNFYFEMPWMKELPTAYFRRHIRLTTQPLGSLPRIESAAAEVAHLAHAKDTVMYGSHFPLYDHDLPDARDRLPAAIRDSVSHGVAESTLRMAVTA
jgi:predicted TIM-barrel fold metal-dependent hydrolase